MSVTPSQNDSLLQALGFTPIERHFQHLMVLPHPANPNLQLVAFQHRGNDSRLDLFTEFKENTVFHPLNTLGDPKNICIGIHDHDNAFAVTMVTAAVEHFKALEA